MKYDHLPREPLGFFPTPLVELRKLSKKLNGPKIFMKRDDNTGLALGGNKTRKLEFILGDALAHGANTIVTAGAAQSNHCRQTAAAAASLGLECHLVLGGKEPAHVNGNLLLDKIFGCHIHWAGQNRKGEDIPTIVEHLKKDGKKPYIVPYGGSNALGALAFVEAFVELQAQLKDLTLSFSHIVFASSSGGTHAGLMLGNKLFKSPCQIVGINIDKDEAGEASFHQTIVSLASSAARLIGEDCTFSDSDLTLNLDYVGEGYGVVGALENEAISMTAQTQGILLDPVYTGKAMGGLIDMIRAGQFKPSDRVLFWHTGGAPALFAYSSALDLAQK